MGYRVTPLYIVPIFSLTPFLLLVLVGANATRVARTTAVDIWRDRCRLLDGRALPSRSQRPHWEDRSRRIKKSSSSPQTNGKTRHRHLSGLSPAHGPTRRPWLSMLPEMYPNSRISTSIGRPGSPKTASRGKASSSSASSPMMPALQRRLGIRQPAPGSSRACLRLARSTGFQGRAAVHHHCHTSRGKMSDNSADDACRPQMYAAIAAYNARCR